MTKVLKVIKMILKEKKAQISVEFILIIAFILILVISITAIISNENELNIAMSSARTGANEGIAIRGMSIYPKTSFDDYINENQLLTYPQDIKIIKITKTDMGYDSRDGKFRIQLKVYAKSNYLKNSADKVSAGDRINFNLRKSIAKTFKTESLSNSLYNPCFSNHYIFTTANVQWI